MHFDPQNHAVLTYFPKKPETSLKNLFQGKYLESFVLSDFIE